MYSHCDGVYVNLVAYKNIYNIYHLPKYFVYISDWVVMQLVPFKLIKHPFENYTINNTYLSLLSWLNFGPTWKQG